MLVTTKFRVEDENLDNCRDVFCYIILLHIVVFDFVHRKNLKPKWYSTKLFHESRIILHALCKDINLTSTVKFHLRQAGKLQKTVESYCHIVFSSRNYFWFKIMPFYVVKIKTSKIFFIHYTFHPNQLANFWAYFLIRVCLQLNIKREFFSDSAVQNTFTWS